MAQIDSTQSTQGAEVANLADLGAGAPASLAAEGFPPAVLGFDSTNYNKQYGYNTLVTVRGTGDVFLIVQGTVGLCAALVATMSATPSGGSIVGSGFKYLVFPPGFTNVPTNAFTSLATAITAATVTDANSPVEIVLAPGSHPVASALTVPTGVHLFGLTGDASSVVITSADATATLVAAQGSQSFSNLTVANTGGGASVQCTNVAGGHALSMNNARFTQTLDGSGGSVVLTLEVFNRSNLQSVSAPAGSVTVRDAQSGNILLPAGTVTIFDAIAADVSATAVIGIGARINDILCISFDLSQASQVNSIGTGAGGGNMSNTFVQTDVSFTGGTSDSITQCTIVGALNTNGSLTIRQSSVGTLSASLSVRIEQSTCGNWATGAGVIARDCVFVLTTAMSLINVAASSFEQCVWNVTGVASCVSVGVGHTAQFFDPTFNSTGSTVGVTGSGSATFSGAVSGNALEVATTLTVSGFARVVADLIETVPVNGVTGFPVTNPGTVLLTATTGIPADSFTLPDPSAQIPGRRILVKNVDPLLGVTITPAAGTIDGDPSMILGSTDFREYVATSGQWISN